MVDAAETIVVDAVGTAILDVFEVAAHESTVIDLIDNRDVAFVKDNLICGTGIAVAAAIVDFVVACDFAVPVNSAVARSVGIISSAFIVLVTGVGVVGVGVDVGVVDSKWCRRSEMNLSTFMLS
jgi:hypothetical protein